MQQYSSRGRLRTDLLTRFKQTNNTPNDPHPLENYRFGRLAYDSPANPPSPRASSPLSPGRAKRAKLDRVTYRSHIGITLCTFAPWEQNPESARNHVQSQTEH
jgi:hypothetical protein